MATTNLSTQGVTGTINYRLFLDVETGEIWAIWGGPPSTIPATVTIAPDDFGADGLFAFRAGDWVAEPLDVRIDPATPTSEENRGKIRAAVLDALGTAVLPVHRAVAKSNDDKLTAGRLRIHSNDAAAAAAAAAQVEADRSAARQAEIDALEAGI